MKKLILFGLLWVAMVACAKNNNVVPVELKGKWSLTSVQCYCHFEENYDFGRRTLDFEVAKKNVTVSNPEDSYFVQKSGEYKFSIDSNVIRFNNEESYTFAITSTKLTLVRVDNPQIADDEITLVYHKSVPQESLQS